VRRRGYRGVAWRGLRGKREELNKFVLSKSDVSAVWPAAAKAACLAGLVARLKEAAEKLHRTRKGDHRG
jgi:hypothetical protein